MVIGLCGGSGSGKTTVSDIFRDMGIPVIDADAVYHEITSKKSECTDALHAEFGNSIINADGSLNRSLLREIVFTDNSQNKLERLNKITHFFVLNKTRELIDDYESQGHRIIVFDAPLLFESGFDSECDLTVCVISPLQSRFDRLITRDALTKEQVISRISNQISDEELMKKCDKTIMNNGSLAELKFKAKEFINNIQNGVDIV